MLRKAATFDIRDMDVLYPQRMAGKSREINREEWSRVIRELLETEAAGNQAELSRLIGVRYQTIRRWLAGSHSVSEESVRAVARAFKLSSLDLLIRVGYWKPDELGSPDAPAAGAEHVDRATEAVDSSNLRPSTKRELFAFIEERRAAFEDQLLADVERLIGIELRARRSA